MVHFLVNLALQCKIRLTKPLSLINFMKKFLLTFWFWSASALLCEIAISNNSQKQFWLCVFALFLMSFKLFLKFVLKFLKTIMDFCWRLLSRKSFSHFLVNLWANGFGHKFKDCKQIICGVNWFCLYKWKLISPIH